MRSPPLPYPGDGDAPPQYVVVISVDGLAPRFVDQLLAEGDLPTFLRLQLMGAWTHNARADATYTVTLPNHTCMLTGRPVTAVDGMPPTIHHGYVYNTIPDPLGTLHNLGNPNVPYIASAMDVVHDRGGRTCFYAGKDKFIIYEQSYNADNGAPDTVEEDNGRDKIDELLIAHGDTPRLINALAAMFRRDPCNFTFLHITETDPGGHSLGWGSDDWLDLVRAADTSIASVLAALETTPGVRDHWALVLTADHGGVGYNHAMATDPNNYVVPFYVVAPGVPGDTDLYSLVGGTRFDPGADRIPYNTPEQPIRNGDATNLALELLGMPYIPGSLIRGMRLVDSLAKQ